MPTGQLICLFDRWRELRAFGGFHSLVRLRDAALVLKHRKARESTGQADVSQAGHVILVRIGRDPADSYATLLHEMAHVAAGWSNGKHHTTTWRRLFLRAALEIQGCKKTPDPAADLWTKYPTHFALHDAIRDGFARMLRKRRHA